MIFTKKRVLTVVYLFILFVLSFFLFFKVTMSKNTYYGLDNSGLYHALVWLSIVFMLALNHFYAKYKLVYNLVLTYLLSRLSLYCTHLVFRMYHLPLDKFFKKGLPQYWYWNFKWFELFVFALVLIVLLELSFYLLRKILKGRERLALRQGKTLD